MVSPVVYLAVAALLVGLILFLTRSRGRAAAGRRCRRARAGGAARPLVSSASVGRGAAAYAHALTCPAQLSRSPRLPPAAGRTPERACVKRRPAGRCSADACSWTKWLGPTPFSWPPKRACSHLLAPLALPEGQALVDTTILYPGSPRLRPLRDPQGFPMLPRPGPEQLTRRGPLSVFYLPANRKEYEAAPGSSLLTPQEHTCVLAPSSLFCTPPGRPCLL